MSPLHPLLRPRPTSAPERARAARVALLVLLALAGGLAGALLAPGSTAHLGPLVVDVSVRPSVHSGVDVRLPPVGSVRFATHHAPLQVSASIRSVDVEEAKRVIDSPASLNALTRGAPDVVRDAAARAAGFTLLGALLGGTLLVALATRTRRGALQGLVATTSAALVLAALTAGTFDSARLAQPRFTGLLSSAPYLQRRTQTLAQRLESYRSGLADFVQSVTTLYAVGQQLPSGASGVASGDVTTVLHVSDMHLNPLGFDLTDRLVEQFEVDVVVDSGDLGTWGTAAEQPFVGRIGSLKVPYVYVRGNHDTESYARAVARQPNAVVLDGTVATVAGLTFAGVADPRSTPTEGSADGLNKQAVADSVTRLAGIVHAYDERNAEAPVQLAVVHDPTRMDALVGQVPIVLSGHLHRRDVSVQDGTRVMIEGSTGGAGLTANGLQSLTDGEPVPLEATLLYFARSGPDAGRLVAYDDVTVGGFGLTSVSIDRTLVPREEVAGPSLSTPSPTTITSSLTTITPSGVASSSSSPPG